MACSEGIILHRIARHDTTDPRPCCGSSSTLPSVIDSRTGIWSPVRPVRDCPPESRLDHDVVAGNDDAAHLEDFRRLLSRWLRQIPGQVSHQGNGKSPLRGRSAPWTLRCVRRSTDQQGPPV
jgi:hypothetical protein